MLATALSHNDLLSEPEQRSVHALIANYEDKLLQLDPEIARVHKVLNGLVSQRKKVIAQIHSCRLAIAPHRKLPREILAEIFICSAPDMVPIVVSKDDAERSAPYNILLVCSRWNNIALGERRLWNGLEVNLDRVSKDFKFSNFAKNTGVVLSRSGLSMISLKVHYRGTRELSRSVSQMMRDLLLRLESRLKMLTLDMGPSSPEFFYDISSGFFDRLEAVSIMVDSVPTDVAVLEAVSGLREFAFTPNQPYVYEQAMFLLPQAQLTALHFGNRLLFRPSEVRVMLHRCTSLVSCKISMMSSDTLSKSVRQSSSTVIPTLRKLQLTLCGPSNPCLQDFSFPGLVSLELSHYAFKIFGVNSWRNDLCPFISRLHKLQSLEVHSDFPPSIAQDILQSVPMLNSLALFAETSLAGNTLVMIANGTLVPRLDCLTCNVDRLSQALDMLESRLKDTRMTTIQDVTIFHKNRGMEKDIKRVEMLRRSGLSITVTSVAVRVDSSSSDLE